MMMKTLIFICSILAFQYTSGQKLIKSYVKQHTKPILPASDDYSDLEPLGQAIGNKRIVMLGELFHGDGTTFQMKGRIIKYLHEKLQFNVLAFESDFFALNDGWEKCKRNMISSDTLINQAIFPIWTRCLQAGETFDYVKTQSSKANPLELSGIDCQLWTAYSSRHLKNELNNFINRSKIEIAGSKEYPDFLTLLDSLADYGWERKILPFERLLHFSDTILQQLKGRFSENEFPVKVLENLHAYCLDYLDQSAVLRKGKGENYRDIQMAENLRWLSEVKYSGKKIIVWAHNGHINCNSDTTSKLAKRYSKFMGYYFTAKKEIRQQTYILGFTQYGGEGEMINVKVTRKVTKPSGKNIESWLKEVGFRFSFIDFNKFRQEHPNCNRRFYMKVFPGFSVKSYWSNAYDGLVFIEEMKPCLLKSGK